MTQGLRITEAVWSVALKYPERIALQFFASDRITLSLTYKQLAEKSIKAENIFRKTGIRPGDRIIIVSENRPEWIVTYLGILKADATAVLIDPSLPPSDIISLTHKTDSRALVLSRSVFEKLPQIDSDKLPILNIEDELSFFEELSNKTLSSDLPPTVDPDPSVASIIFTSGTTGLPKGVEITHDSLLYCSHKGIDLLKSDFTDSSQHLLGILPFHHLAGLTCLAIAPLLSGAKLTIVENVSPQSILQALKVSQANVLPGVPRLFELLYNRINDQIKQKGKVAQTAIELLGAFCEWVRSLTPWNLGFVIFRPIHQELGGHLRYLLCGAAPLSTEVKRGLERFGFTLLEGYGLTESGICVFNTLNQSRLGHVGKPYECIQLRIDKSTQDHDEGEICFQGISVMKGYFRDPEATATVMRDGWLHTGDLGSLDAKGNLAITGRMKEIIVLPTGKKAAPESIEKYYQGLSDVQDLAVLGFPKAAGVGEEIHAAIVLNKDSELDGSNLQGRLQKAKTEINLRSLTVPSYCQIQQVHVIEAIPRTSTLKVKRGELLKIIQNNLTSLAKEKEIKNIEPISKEEISPDNRVIIQKVIDVTREVLRLDLSQKIDPQQSFIELGMDSLISTEIQERLENRLGVSLSETALFEYPTIEAIASHISLEKDKSSAVIPDSLLGKLPRSDSLPLSFAQEFFWYVNPKSPGLSDFNIPFLLHIKGKFNLEIFEKSLKEIVKRHDSLRTYFFYQGDRPVQRIADSADLSIDIIDLKHLSNTEQLAKSARLSEEDATEPFNLFQPPLLRVKILWLKAEEYKVLLTMHHHISDGTSVFVFIEELRRLYEAFSNHDAYPLAPLPIDCADFTIWQRHLTENELVRSQLPYWQNHLKNIQPLELPTDYSRPQQETNQCAFEPFEIPQPFALKTLGNQEGCTLLMLLHGALAILLYSYNKQASFVTKTVVHNRKNNRLKNLIGCLSQLLNVRHDINDDLSLKEVIRNVRQTFLEAYRYGDLQPGIIYGLGGIDTGSSVELNVHIFPAGNMTYSLNNSEIHFSEQISVSQAMRNKSITLSDLVFHISEDSKVLYGALEYKSELFNPVTIQKMIKNFLAILNLMVDDKELRIASLVEKLQPSSGK